MAWPISSVYCRTHNQKAHIDLLTKFISLQKLNPKLFTSLPKKSVAAAAMVLKYVPLSPIRFRFHVYGNGLYFSSFFLNGLLFFQVFKQSMICWIQFESSWLCLKYITI